MQGFGHKESSTPGKAGFLSPYFLSARSGTKGRLAVRFSF